MQKRTEHHYFDISDELGMVEDLDVVTPCNYGGIGAVIAHEITHGYDDKGRKFDGDGNLNDWWSEKDGQLFQKKTEIMVSSVEKYVYKDEESGKIRLSQSTSKDKESGGSSSKDEESKDEEQETE